LLPLLFHWLGAKPRESGAKLRVGICSAGLGQEEYRLMISRSGISLEAGSREGLVRGASTLRQLAISGGSHLPLCEIDDGPRFSWRGFMLDTARNWFPVEFVERLIDAASLHKLNIFHWHFCDDQAWSIDLPGLPELAREGSFRLDRRYNEPVKRGGAYSAEDVRRIVGFAAERGIVVVPELEAPGHATALLASHPELSCVAAALRASPAGGAGGQSAARFEPEDSYGVFADVLCAGNDAAFALLERIVDGLVELFPGPYIHVGGDEVPKARWKECPACAARMRELGLSPGEEEALQPWFMGKMAAMLAKRGKRMIGWDEVLDPASDDDSARKLGGLPPDAVVMSWRGYEGGIVGARLGHDVVMCPYQAGCYLDYKQFDSPEEPGRPTVSTARDSYAFEPAPPGLAPELSARFIGGQANLWSEFMYSARQVEYMAFPRLCAISEALWSPDGSRDFEDFSRRLPSQLQRLDALGIRNYYKGPLC
jgi:N-acetyl-beta-hexosaminidase